MAVSSFLFNLAVRIKKGLLTSRVLRFLAVVIKIRMNSPCIRRISYF
jgi:hypothetical protein